MNNNENQERFPQQTESEKIHGDNGGRFGQEITNQGTDTVTRDNPGNRNENDNSDSRTINEGKEKYLGEIANIEDVPSDDDREPVDENSPDFKKKSGL